MFVKGVSHIRNYTDAVLAAVLWDEANRPRPLRVDAQKLGTGAVGSVQDRVVVVRRPAAVLRTGVLRLGPRLVRDTELFRTDLRRRAVATNSVDT